MLRISPILETAFFRHIEHFDVAPTGHAIVVASDGQATMLGPSLETIGKFRLPQPVHDVRVSPYGYVAAFVHQGQLRLCEKDGDDPHFPWGYASAGFSSDGMSVWCVKEKTHVDVYDLGSGLGIAEGEIDDPFGDSDLTFFPHPNGVHVAIWQNAGQDGQRIVWARVENESILFELLEDVDDCSPPAFDTSGDRFLIVARDELRQYSFADDILLGTMPYSFDDDMFAPYLAYAGDDRAVCSSNEGNMYVIDVSTMTVVDELSVGGLSELRYFSSGADQTVVSLHGHGNSRAVLWRLP